MTIALPATIETLVATTVTFSPHDGTDVVEAARQRVDAALTAGYAARHASHAAWWSDFWAKSSVTIPDAQVLQHYHLVQYFYGAASRKGVAYVPAESFPRRGADLHQTVALVPGFIISFAGV